MQRVPPYLTTRARELRAAATPAERVLWRLLAPHRPRFTRQLVVDRFIVDIACRQVRLAVELDGAQHVDCAADAERTAALEALGWTVMRFWNLDVLRNPKGVAQTVLDAAAGRSTGHVITRRSIAG